MPKDPKVGIGCCIALYRLVVEDDDVEVLMGHRIGSLGTDTWGLPGGWHDFGEQPVDTSIRELLEEAGLPIARSRVELLDLRSHYLRELDVWCATAYYKAHVAGVNLDKLRIMEPEKCDEWRWFSLKALPENLFESTGLALKTLGEQIRQIRSSAVWLTPPPAVLTYNPPPWSMSEEEKQALLDRMNRKMPDDVSPEVD